MFCRCLQKYMHILMSWEITKNPKHVKGGLLGTQAPKSAQSIP
jgi:hypothetical protein